MGLAAVDFHSHEELISIPGNVAVLTHLPLDKMAAILADDISKHIFLNEKLWILIEISLKFVPKGPIDNNPAFVEIMAWRRLGDKPLSEPMLTRFTDAHMREMSWFQNEHCYRNWYQYWGHCCLINDLGSSPQPEGEARVLWWASQVVNETTMTEIEVSISILSWWNQINDE